MQKIDILAADAVQGNKPFKLTEQEVDGNGACRIAIRKGANFDSKTITLEVEDPTTPGDWYNTGISFTAENAVVARLRQNYNYRLFQSAIGGALAVRFMFF